LDLPIIENAVKNPRRSERLLAQHGWKLEPCEMRGERPRTRIDFALAGNVDLPMGVIDLRGEEGKGFAKLDEGVPIGIDGDKDVACEFRDVRAGLPDGLTVV